MSNRDLEVLGVNNPNEDDFRYEEEQRIERLDKISHLVAKRQEETGHELNEAQAQTLVRYIDRALNYDNIPYSFEPEPVYEVKELHISRPFGSDSIFPVGTVDFILVTGRRTENYPGASKYWIWRNGGLSKRGGVSCYKPGKRGGFTCRGITECIRVYSR